MIKIEYHSCSSLIIRLVFGFLSDLSSKANRETVTLSGITAPNYKSVTNLNKIRNATNFEKINEGQTFDLKLEPSWQVCSQIFHSHIALPILTSTNKLKYSVFLNLLFEVESQNSILKRKCKWRLEKFEADLCWPEQIKAKPFCLKLKLKPKL